MHRQPHTAGSAARVAPRAVLLDLDGTLYHQRPLRRRMLSELLLHPLRSRSPRRAWREVRRLRAFRSTREELRALGRPDEALSELQFEAPARALGERPEEVQATVREWMEERPLSHLAAFVREGAHALLEELAGRGLAVGVLSDYPVGDKLDALGLRRHVSLELCTTDPEINAFKPHPAGFLHAAARWGIEPERVLYVGDRVDVDAAGARAAGMDCVICGRGPAPEYPPAGRGGEVWTDAIRRHIHPA